MDTNPWDEIFRLLAAAGIAIGVNREMQSKPLGMRTLVVLMGLGWVERKMFPANGATHTPQNIDKT